MAGIEREIEDPQETLESAGDLPVISTNHDAIWIQSMTGIRRLSAPLRCKVSGCTSDLASAPKTHQRFRLCNAHIKAPIILVDGVASRFCQQCSRFHPLTEFHGTNRTCRMMLIKNRARQRGLNPCSSTHGTPAALRERSPPPVRRVFHTVTATALPAIAASSPVGHHLVQAAMPQLLTIAQPGDSAAMEWQLAQTRLGFTDATADTADGTCDDPRPARTLAGIAPLLHPPKGYLSSALPPALKDGSGVSTCPAVLGEAAAATKLPLPLPSEVLHGTPDLLGAARRADYTNEPPPLHLGSKSGTLAKVAPVGSPPSAPCSPSTKASRNPTPMTRTFSAAALAASVSAASDAMASKAADEPEAMIQSDLGDMTVAAAAAAMDFQRRSSDGAVGSSSAGLRTCSALPVATTFEGGLCAMAEQVSRESSENEYLVNNDYNNDNKSTGATQPAVQGPLVAGPFARCSAPPALGHLGCGVVGGSPIPTGHPWQPLQYQIPIQQASAHQQLQEQQRRQQQLLHRHAVQEAQLIRRPSTPQYDRFSLQRMLLQKHSITRMRGDRSAASGGDASGLGDLDGLLAASGGDIGCWGLQRNAAGHDDNGDYSNASWEAARGPAAWTAGVYSGLGSGSVSSLFGRMSAPPPDTSKLQAELRCHSSGSMNLDAAAVAAAVAAGPMMPSALRQIDCCSGAGAGWKLERAGSLGSFKRRRSIGSTLGDEDEASCVRHCSNAGLSDPSLGAVVESAMGRTEAAGERSTLNSQQRSLPRTGLSLATAAAPSPSPSASASLRWQQRDEVEQMAVAMPQSTLLAAGEFSSHILSSPASANPKTVMMNAGSGMEIWSASGQPNICVVEGLHDGSRGLSSNKPEGVAGLEAGHSSVLGHPQDQTQAHAGKEQQGAPQLLPLASAAVHPLQATPPRAVGGVSPSSGSAPQTSREVETLVLDGLLLDEKREHRDGTKGAAAVGSGSGCPDAKAGAPATVPVTATGDPTGSKASIAEVCQITSCAAASSCPAQGDSLVFASMAAEWRGEGEGEPDGIDELLLGLDDAGRLMRCRDVEMQSAPLATASPLNTALRGPWPQLSYLDAINPRVADSLSDSCRPAAAPTAATAPPPPPAFARVPMPPVVPMAPIAPMDCSSLQGAAAFECAGAANMGERSPFPDSNGKLVYGNEPAVLPLPLPAASGVCLGVELGVQQSGGQMRQMWLRSAQSEPCVAWGVRHGDARNQKPHCLRQHQLGQILQQPWQPTRQQQHHHHHHHHQDQQQHQEGLAVQHVDRMVRKDGRDNRERAGADDGVCVVGGSGAVLQLPCRNIAAVPSAAAADTSSERLVRVTHAEPEAMVRGLGLRHKGSARLNDAPRKTIGAETEEQLLLLLGDLIGGSRDGGGGDDSLSQPLPSTSPSTIGVVAAAVQQAQVVSLLPSSTQHVCCSFGLPQAAADLQQLSVPPPEPPPPQQQKLLEQRPIQQLHQDRLLRSEGTVPIVEGVDGVSASETAPSQAPRALCLAAMDCARSGGSGSSGCGSSYAALAAFAQADSALVTVSENGDSASFHCNPSQSPQQTQQTQPPQRPQPQQALSQPHLHATHGAEPSARRSRRNHRFNHCSRGGYLADDSRPDREFLDHALQRQRQLWDELRAMQEQQHALLERQLEQQRALTRLLGGAQMGAASQAVGSRSAEETSSQAQQHQEQKEQQQQQDGEHIPGASSCSSTIHPRPTPAFGRWSMPVLNDRADDASAQQDLHLRLPLVLQRFGNQQVPEQQEQQRVLLHRGYHDLNGLYARYSQQPDQSRLQSRYALIQEASSATERHLGAVDLSTGCSGGGRDGGHSLGDSKAGQAHESMLQRGEGGGELLEHKRLPFLQH